MTIGTAFANDLAKLLFNGTALANIADNAASRPLTDYQIALHTASPGSGDQTANESTDLGICSQSSCAYWWLTVTVT